MCQQSEPPTELSNTADAIRRAGTYLLAAAGAVSALSLLACFVIQDLLPPSRFWELIGFIAYFGGPLPVFPAMLATLGGITYAVAWSYRRLP